MNPNEHLPHDIQRFVNCAGRDLQAIEDALKSRDRKCEIKFPVGYFRRAETFRQRWWFISEPTLRRNLAYSLILSDANRWVLNRLNLIGTARELFIKQGIYLIANILESVTINFLGGRKGGYEKRVKWLLENLIIGSTLASDLKKVWDQRDAMHLFLVKDREHGKYELSDYNRAVKALRELRDALEKSAKAAGKKPPPFP